MKKRGRIFVSQLEKPNVTQYCEEKTARSDISQGDEKPGISTICKVEEKPETVEETQCLSEISRDYEKPGTSGVNESDKNLVTSGIILHNEKPGTSGVSHGDEKPGTSGMSEEAASSSAAAGNSGATKKKGMSKQLQEKLKNIGRRKTFEKLERICRDVITRGSIPRSELESQPATYGKWYGSRSK